ncbi:hypothetical protein PCANC_04794 [Puccinia coronata f. sp. avenae]|uniref:Ubiquitin carboxyl-terminal hydrolase n=1 Tax=Puccinia coronata f. sp. avenae TaxID=200324 RepID=A0A2N5VWQ6_9BASI|nr:hypothetical protein PCANC_04794 [Puccinia coronata f. sp. avenae]
MAAVASSSHLHLHLNHLIINNEQKQQQPEQTNPELKLQPSQLLGKLWEQALQQPIKFTKSANPPNLTHFPYPPINHTHPPPVQAARPSNPPPSQPSINNPTPSSSAAEHASKKSTTSRLSQSHSVATQVATSWIRPQPIGPGFHNTGNTCFLNATLQALVHTPALAIGLMDRNEHSPESCGLARDKKFCALCRMYRLVNMCFDKATYPAHAIEPSPINRALSKFAPTMRGGRQEDAHEFLRLLVEAMQNGALQGRAERAKQKQKESTFVHRMFGGKLRSRVVCEHCNTPSDTFDNFLDLSLDISQANSVTSALKAYHKFDRLRGANQYKCDTCKCLRDAKKSMSVFSAPPILTLHLKRFNFRGRKINKRVNFEDSLDLKPAMSNESDITGYKLYAVVCHRGQSNKSGHYYAHVKASNGKWYVADDSTIESIPDSRAVLANEHAYILFYARDRESLLSAAIHGNRPSAATAGLDVGDRGSLFKRKPSISNDSYPQRFTPKGASEHSDQSSSQNENGHKRVKTGSTHCSEPSPKRFIGPLLPPRPLPKSDGTDPHGPTAPADSTKKPSPSPDQDGSQSGTKSSPISPPIHSNSQQDQQMEEDEEGEQPMNQMKKKKRNRKPKSKHRRLVNIAGTQVGQVSSFRPRLITG